MPFSTPAMTNRSIALRSFACGLLLILATGLLPAPGATAEPGKLRSVGVTLDDLGNPFFVALGRGAEAMAKEFGGNDTKVSIVSADNDLERQVKQMADFVAAGEKLILLNAADSRRIAPAVQQAKQAGATVVAVDVAADGGVDATVTSDNRQAGEEAAKYIAARLKGRGNVVIINGPPVTAVQDRVGGAIAVLAKYPGINILSQDQNGGGSRDGGLKVMTDLLHAHDKIDAVFAENDPTGVGVDLAAIT